MRALDGAEEPGKTLGEHDSVTLRELVSKFFGFPSERLQPNTSLISLGLDSIQSVGLSKILRQHGYFLRAMDIMENPTLQELGVLCTRSLDHSAQVEIEQGILSLQKRCENIKATLNPLTCKLSVDDEVEIFPTTALQNGMISQVTIFFTGFLLVVPYS